MQQQKIEVFDLEKAGEAWCAAKKIDPDQMSEADCKTLALSLLDEFIEWQNNAGFHVSIISHSEPLAPTRFLCTKEKVSSPQRAMMLHLWKDEDVVAVSDEDLAKMTDLRLKEELKKLNAAHIAVDDMALFNINYENYLFLITHDA